MQTKHFPPLDGLRGVAILLVLLVHSFKYHGPSSVGQFLDAVARAGWVGVTLFFVLSGFLITGILLDSGGRRHGLRDFFARRCLRIFPLYFAFLAFYFLLVPRLGGMFAILPQPDPDAKIVFWTYLSNMKQWLAGPVPPMVPLDPLWSLGVEEQVYLAWPFVIVFVPRRWLATVLAALAVGSLGWRCGAGLLGYSMEVLYAYTPANLDGFAAGAAVALYSRERPAALRVWAPRVAWASGFFLFGLIFGQAHYNIWDAPFRMLTIGSFAAVVFFAAVIGVSVTTRERSLLNRVLSVSLLRYYGKYSYAIYLLHGSVAHLFFPVAFNSWTGYRVAMSIPGCLLYTVGVTVTSFVLGWLSWNLFERHILKLKRYFPRSGRVVLPMPEPEPDPRTQPQ